MLRSTFRSSRAGLSNRRCEYSRSLCTRRGPGSSTGSNLLRPSAHNVGKRAASRSSLPSLTRCYAMTAEETNKGVVSSSIYPCPVAVPSSRLRSRIRMTLSYKAIPPTTLMRCTCNGSMTHPAFTSRGKSTFGTWRAATCPCPKLFSHHPPSFRLPLEAFHKPCLAQASRWNKEERSQTI